MKEVSALNDIYQYLKNKIKKQWIVAFVATIVIGLFTYGYLMTNRFLTYDSMWNMYSDQDMISSGRQFLTYACGISSYYDLPYLNGFLAILYLAVTAIFLVEIFKVENYISVVLVSGLLVTFPSIISTFGYSFTVDGYMLALLLVTIAFWLTDNKKYGCLSGAVLLGISLGIYQAYLAFLMILCVLTLLLYLLEERNYKKIFVKIGQYAVMGIGGYIFYVVTLNVMLSAKGIELSGYQGTDRINSFALSQLPEGLNAARINFIDFIRYANVLTTTDMMKIVVILLAVIGVSAYGYLLLVNKVYKKIGIILLIGALTISIPFCATVINILSPYTVHHLLLRGAWSLFFIFSVVLVERASFYSGPKEKLCKKIFSVVALVCSVILIFEFSKMAHVVGFNMQERYEKNYALALRIVERLEMTEGYSHGMKVAILGGEPDETLYPTTDITKNDLVGYFGVDGDYSLNSTEKYAAFLSHFMNVTIQTIDYSEEIDLTLTPEFQKMEKFPDSECIKQIGDVWVVKLNG